MANCNRCRYSIVASIGGIYHGPELLCTGCYRAQYGETGPTPIISVMKKEVHYGMKSSESVTRK
jgi:hypothetical protein